jgi:hypothetical protein
MFRAESRPIAGRTTIEGRSPGRYSMPTGPFLGLRRVLGNEATGNAQRGGRKQSNQSSTKTDH